MSIGKRVSDAFEKLLKDDAESALFQLCAAIGETARREGRSKGRSGYKAFIADNVSIICGFGLGYPIGGLRIGFVHPDLPTSSDGTAGIEDIVYHLLRCALYHSAALPATVRLTENKIGSGDTDKLLLPKTLVNGLIAAVVTSPANADERTEAGHFLLACGERFKLNEMRGRRAEVSKRLEDLVPCNT